MRKVARWIIVAVAATHGLVHLLGAAKGLGWAEIDELGPISAGMGVAWLGAGGLVIGAAVLLAVGYQRWWVLAGDAALASQVLVAGSWSDASAGTAANVVLVAAAVYGYLSTGPRSFRAESVTVLNDLCVFAPGALVDAPISWEVVDDHHVLASYTNGSHTVTAELVFNEHGELVDFVSDDRLAATSDGRGFEAQRWSTPLRDYTDIGGRRLAAVGEGRWHPPGQSAFTYLELGLDGVAYDLGPQPALAEGRTDAAPAAGGSPTSISEAA